MYRRRAFGDFRDEGGTICHHRRQRRLHLHQADVCCRPTGHVSNTSLASCRILLDSGHAYSLHISCLRSTVSSRYKTSMTTSTYRRIDQFSGLLQGCRQPDLCHECSQTGQGGGDICGRPSSPYFSLRRYSCLPWLRISGQSFRARVCEHLYHR